MKSRTQGFTLFELMIVVALAGIILGIGAPSFREFVRNTRLTSAGNDFLSALLLARTEAIKRQQPVSLCASDNPDTATPSCSNGAYTGWIVFEDHGTNCVLDGGDTLLRAQGPLDAQVKTSATGSCMPFAPTGFLQPQASDPDDHIQRVLFCDDRGTRALPGSNQSAARGLTVTPTGRARVLRDVGPDDADTNITMWAISCP